jgi:hypothetical protein
LNTEGNCVYEWEGDAEGGREDTLPWAMSCARINANEHTNTQVGKTVEQWYI